MLLNYHIRRFVLGSLCVGYLVRLDLSGFRVADNTDTTQTSNTQHTKNETTDVIINNTVASS